MVTTPVGDTPQEYDIEIKRICNRDMTSNENFVIKITDSRLLENCGGIVQGMSGSPIVQNGKIIGAVTHVFLNNPKEGYCVFTQYMANRYNNQHKIYDGLFIFDLVTQNIKLYSQFSKKVLWKVLPTLPFCGNISTTKITGGNHNEQQNKTNRNR